MSVGSRLILPVAANIVLIDLFYGVDLGGTVAALVLLLCALGVVLPFVPRLRSAILLQKEGCEVAVVEMLKEKQSGKTIRKETARAPDPRGGNVIDLLKRSIEMETKKPRTKAPASRTKTRAKQRA